ncbi:hypothetical protein EDC04DRAFT_2604713 [Pisolithus marmoratus]|nr:hypothetical protein EDC04DRAFT_2604713 [Pisolithus marmoratus]
MANLNLSLISTYIALCSTKKCHSHIPSTNLSTYSFGDVLGLGPLGSLVQDLALVYPPLQTSQTQIHAQMRAIVPSPETWVRCLPMVDDMVITLETSWLYPEVTNLSIQPVQILMVVMPSVQLC